MAAFVAEHNLAFTITDHLVKLMSAVCYDSKVGKGLTCGRTKANGIVRNVIGAENFKVVCDNLRGKKFSLIVDESTDLSSLKHLCLVVRYVNDDDRVQDHFFCLIKLSGADATTLYNEIVKKFTKFNIPYKSNMIGFASDGANVMMGAHHSLMVLLKNDVPSLYVMKCICHSFHLCASYACQKLPRFVEDLTRDIHNYFSSSPKRRIELQEFQKFCNIKIHKILHPSQTRWLSVHMVVSRILEQYNALKLFFTDAVANKDILAAETILLKLNDNVTKLFLQFLDFILPIFNNLNKEMQSEAPTLHVLYKNVCNALRTLYDCFLIREYISSTPIEDIDFRNPQNYLPIENCYFGASVNITIANQNISGEQLHFFRLRCIEFYIEACIQVTTRFPLKNNPLKLLNFLDPTEVKRGNIASIADVVALFPHFIETKNIQEVDTQWRMLRNLREVQGFSDELQLFWQEVKKITSGDGLFTFSTLTTFAFDILCLPHSSANVERMFSAVNLMKTKQRNALNTETMTGLLHCKQYMKSDNCYDFPIVSHLVSKMQKDTIYKSGEA